MPHSDQDKRLCPYCGQPVRKHGVTCTAHTDLPKLEPLDDRYLVAQDGKRV